MKKYFAKYIPVDGTIYKGDKFLFTGTNVVYEAAWIPLSNPVLIASKCGNAVVGEEDCRKVKLFLCSTEIQAGDKVLLETFEEVEVYEKHGTIWGRTLKNRELEIFTDRDFKVIGPILTSAKWVKEGDQFNEDEIKLIIL